MHRGVIHLCAFWLTLTASVSAFAHGIPPDAYAVLAHDAQGPLAVSLSVGVALRRAAQSYQFVCPMRWGDQFAAPVAALADGTIVLGATKGLMLLGEDGTLRAHPDPAAVGRSSDVVRSALGVFSLRTTAQGSELIAVDAQQVRVLWKDPNTLYSLAAMDDKLVLLRARADAMTLEQVTIAAADGTELNRQTAMLDMPVDNVYARSNAGVAYAVLAFRSGTIALGTIAANAFSKLAEGEVSIAGPLTIDGLTLIAVDGKLAQLVADQMMPLTDDHNVVCLGAHDQLTYACESHGIVHVIGPALAEPLFRFEWLVAPDLTAVPDMDDRFLCNSQWQDLRFDMQLITPDALSATFAADLAGSGGAPLMAAPATAGVGGQLMAAMPIAGAGGEAGAGAMAVPPQQVQTRGAGCSVLAGRRASNASALGLLIALALCGRRRRRGTKLHGPKTIFDRF